MADRVGAIGGTLTVHSQEGEYTEFVAMLPYASPAADEEYHPA